MSFVFCFKFCSSGIILSLSAAFDTINHSILIERLKYTFGITNSALSWFQSYLDRKTLMFSKPMGEICKRHDMLYHCYADDSQIYLVIEPIDNWSEIFTRLEACAGDNNSWMKSNLLKLYQDKTELIFAPKHRLKEFKKCQLALDGTIVSDATCVKNLGVHLDKSLSMEQYIYAVSKSCLLQIRKIDRIRWYIRTVLAKH